MKSSPFRSIRQKLFNEGKLLRYLGYAIGEIALIIIGIMLALQLNNWNEDRKAQAEFEVYVEQLKSDVKKAILNASYSKEFMENQVKHAELVLSSLKQALLDSESLTALEKGLTNLGNYNEPQVSVGLLGHLLSGNMETISRDPILAQKALEAESVLEMHLSNLDHIYNQVDLASNHISLYRGKGNANVMPTYDLETLKASDEFRNVTHTLASRKRTMVNFCGQIISDLEAFLAVLEEY